VSQQQGQALADELGIPFMEVSAKGGINVEKAFYTLASDIKKRIIDNQGRDGGDASKGGVNVGANGQAEVKGGCC